jgi:cytochrome P450
MAKANRRMQLISQTAVEGRPGPVFPEAYPRFQDLNFNSAKAFARGQPFETFARLRMAAPVAWHPEPDGLPGFWAVTRHADVMRVNGDPATFSSQRGGILKGCYRSHAADR